MTVLEHLAELRTRLMYIFGALTIGAIPGWFAYRDALRILLEPAEPYLPEGQLIVTSPVDAFSLRLKIALYIGFALAFPFVLFHVWRFIAPGLRAQEKRYVIPFVISGMLLFSVGIWVAFYTLPQAMAFLIGPRITGPQVVPLLAARQYIDFMLRYLVVFGLTFQFPIVLMFLTISRAVSSKQLARYRRHVVLVIAVVGAVATPPDPVSMMILSGALYALFESCIWLSRLLRR
ncbi:MAG TPA: twin-arginine translocase subunit TatC [Actinomycetota bacterium]|nr:twin-arginine translocase subunit TatC [Actinomycetota bacterium]